jgi:DNA-binding response OmpR family regulator
MGVYMSMKSKSEIEGAFVSEKIALLIEDDFINAKIQEMILRKAGFHVVSCRTGDEGIEALNRENFDLIVTDLNFPLAEGNGIDVLFNYGKRDDSKKAPVVIVSGEVNSKWKEMSFLLGANDFISKPFTCADYRRKIFEIVASKGGE